jgi:hypothetical protein
LALATSILDHTCALAQGDDGGRRRWRPFAIKKNGGIQFLPDGRAANVYVF